MAIFKVQVTGKTHLSLHRYKEVLTIEATSPKEALTNAKAYVNSPQWIDRFVIDSSPTIKRYKVL